MNRNAIQEKGSLDMVNGGVCDSCGWQNTGPARLCGGCGRPLRQVGTPGDNARTMQLPQSLGPAVPAAAGYSGPDTQPDPARREWPVPAAGGGGATSGRRRSGPRRLLSLVLTLAVVAGILLGAWVVAIRPAIHGAVDSRVRSALDSGVSQVPDVPFLAALGPINVHLQAADVNNALARDLPPDSPVSDAHVQFANGQVVVTFSAAGQQSQVTTRLTKVDGHLKAADTHVSCPFCLVESDAEMQSAFNDALSQLPSNYKVTKLSVGQDEITLTVTGR